ncbi:MAG: complex I subunit 5 family protein, partial [Candidatus Hadarchaeaceae archaeon]
NYPRARDYFALVIVVGTLLLVVDVATSVWGDNILVYQLGGWAPPLGINLAIDGLGLLIGLIVAGISTLVVIYSLVFMKQESGLGQYYTLMLLLTAGMMGVAFTGDIFNLYVFFEIMSISSYALVAFRRSEISIEGSMKYLIIGSLGTSFILLGIALLYGLTGTLNIADIASKLGVINTTAASTPLISIVALTLFVVGFGVKIGMIPFHAWLPDAYQSAPSPISAVMAGGTAMVGVGALLRVSYFLFGASMVGPLLVGFGIVTMVLGAFMALVQRDLKRLLAYSGISQMGYILLSIGLGTALGIKGGLFHMLNNAIYKSLLFLAVGAIIYRVKTSRIDELGGLGRKMPITAGIFMVGALALAGVPPFNGFASKLTIYLAGIDAGYPIFSGIAAIISAVTLAYMIRAFNAVFLGPRTKRFENVKEAPPSMLFPMMVLAIVCVMLGVLPQLGFSAVEPAQGVLLNPSSYIREVVLGA